MKIYTNTLATVTQNELNTVDAALVRSTERLSSGLRINHASDDASGLAMSDKLREQINGLSNASFNAQDAVSLLQTMESGLEVITDMLQRLRELAVQASNTVYTSNDRLMLQKETDQLKSEINRMATASEYNTLKLLNGSASGSWSSSSANIEAIISGAPQAGLYKLNFHTAPGENAVYRSGILFEDTLTHTLHVPDGVANLDVSDWTLDFSMTVVDKKIDVTPDRTGSSLTFKSPTVIYDSNSTVDTGFNFAVYEDHQGTDKFDYAGDYFSGLYIGMEKVSYNDRVGNPYLTSGTGDNETPVAGAALAITLTDGSIAMRVNKDATANEDSTWVKIFFMNPETGNRQYAECGKAFGDAPSGAGVTDRFTAFIKPDPRQDNDGLPIEVWFSANKFLTLGVGDKFVAYHQANSPDVGMRDGYSNYRPTITDPSKIITFEVEVALPESTKTTHGNVKNYIYWDGESHAKFTVLTVQNGQFKEITVEWDRDYGFDMDEIQGSVSVSTDHKDINSVKMKDTFNAVNSEGRNVFDLTQALTIYGNNRQVDVYIEGNDTIKEFVEKLSNAIIIGLDMGSKDVAPEDLVKFIDTNEVGEWSNNSVHGTVLIQTALAGKASDLHFSANEDLLNALAITAIRQSSENQTSVVVSDASSGRLIGRDTVSDGILRNIIKGVDVKINTTNGISTKFNNESDSVVFTPDGDSEAFLHIVERSMQVLVGANEGQNFDISDIGKINTTTLGIADAFVMTAKDARQAITKFDQALNTVNHSRAVMGAQIQRLAYVMNNINVGQENILAAESRIKDLNVADESATFTRNQIILNAAIAMAAQANQMPQSALQLIDK